LTDFGSQNQMAFNPTTPVVMGGREIDMPKGFGEQASDFGSKIMNFFSGDKKEETDQSEVSGNKDDDSIAFAPSFEVVPTGEEIFSDTNTVTEGGEIDLASNAEGGNTVVIEGDNKQVSNNQKTPPATSNIFVKSTFSDNSKISYILEYGGASVVG